MLPLPRAVSASSDNYGLPEIPMTKHLKPNYLELSAALEANLIAGARDSHPVRGLTHGYYKYPARFSPRFVRAAIEAFTRPGDLCFDPHVGGGTTLVEAMALGRNAIGVDISTLAEFVSTVKTTVFSKSEIEALKAWSQRVSLAIDMRKKSNRLSDYDKLGYYKHLNSPSRWRLRKAIEQSIASAARIGSVRLEAFGRCAVLRTAQWALDGRKELPCLGDFRSFLLETIEDMIQGAEEFRERVLSARQQPTAQVINRSAAGIEEDHRLRGAQAPRLVVTSPPYPGVHVLYHRWQVDGRKEAPLPFMIANKLDGAGSSYYTMGDRKYPELKTYFDNIRASMSSVAALSDHNTIIVQMVAFSDPSWQLPRYLKTMEEAGLYEVLLPSLEGHRDGRLWRSVPSRRWYSEQRGETPGSQEVVLIHKKQVVAPTKQPFRPNHSRRPHPQLGHQELGS